jgi:hypothetical protein
MNFISFLRIPFKILLIKIFLIHFFSPHYFLNESKSILVDLVSSVDILVDVIEYEWSGRTANNKLHHCQHNQAVFEQMLSTFVTRLWCKFQIYVGLQLLLEVSVVLIRWMLVEEILICAKTDIKLHILFVICFFFMLIDMSCLNFSPEPRLSFHFPLVRAVSVTRTFNFRQRETGLSWSIFFYENFSL